MSKPTRRERTLWITTAALLLVIYSTLGLVRQVANALRDQGYLALFVGLTFGLAGLVIVGLLVARRRPSAVETAALVAIAAVYALTMQLFQLPEERLHLLEYGAVGALVYQALLERRKRLPASRLPAAPTALLLTGLAGWVDEGIQAVLPSRYYDLRDVGFNFLAGSIAIAATQLLLWARRRRPHGSNQHG